MRRNHFISRGLLVVGVLLLATAISQATVTIKGQNETVQIKLPDGWKEARPPENSPPSTELAAVNDKIGAVLIVNVEEATEATPKLDDYLKSATKEMTKTYGDLTAGKPQTGRVNGKDCLRCEMKYTFDGKKVGAVVSVVKVDTHYERVTCLTAIENFTRMKSALAALGNELTDISAPVGPDVTIKGKDSLFQFTFTGDWKQQPLPVGSPVTFQMFVKSFKQNAGFEVYSFAKADLTEDMHHLLDEHVQALSKEFGDFTHTDPEMIKLNAFEGLHCEATGTLKDKDFKLTFLVTAVQTPTQFLIIDESCADKAYNRLKPIFLKPLGSLKELTATAKADPDADPPVLGRLTAMKNKESTLQIGLPHGWKTNPLPADASKSMQISATSMQDGTDLLVVMDDRKDATLPQYVDATVAAFSNDSNITDVTHTDPQTIKINGKDAAQFEIHCTIGGSKLGYLITITQTDKSFLRSQFSSTESKFAKMKPIFIQLAPGLKQGAADDNSDDQ